MNSVKTNKHIFKTFPVGYPNHPSLSILNVIAIFRRGLPNPGGIRTNRDSGRIAAYQSMAAALCGQQLTVVGALDY